MYVFKNLHVTAEGDGRRIKPGRAERINRICMQILARGRQQGGCQSGAETACRPTALLQGQHPPSTLQHPGRSHRRLLSCAGSLQQAAASAWTSHCLLHSAKLLSLGCFPSLSSSGFEWILSVIESSSSPNTPHIGASFDFFSLAAIERRLFIPTILEGISKKINKKMPLKNPEQ